MKPIGSTLVLADHVIAVHEGKDGMTIRVYEYHKTERQKKYGGYTIDKLIDTHEIQWSKK